MGGFWDWDLLQREGFGAVEDDGLHQFLAGGGLVLLHTEISNTNLKKNYLLIFSNDVIME